jgi:hypothetical protein
MKTYGGVDVGVVEEILLKRMLNKYDLTQWAGLSGS